MQQLVDNRYRLERMLGSGGMADVFLAHDSILDRDVALKVMSDRYADDEEFVERFKREAQSAAALSHSNIVSIYDRGESEDGTYYIAMEYLPGGTLKDRILKRGAIQPQVAAEVTLQIAEALRAAHRRGVVHRDIKPHNILITDSGDVKVTDFGIARAATSSTMTKTGAVLGTAHYISPEQAMGESVSPASDLYSLGVVLYEMLTGELPYDADTPIGIAMQHVNGALRPPREVDPSIPEGIEAITCRLLAKNPEDRYASAQELIDNLGRYNAGMAPLDATTQVMDRVVPDEEKTLVGKPPAQRRQQKKRGGFLPLLILPLLLLLALLAWAGYGLVSGQENPLSQLLFPNTGSQGNQVNKIEVPDLKGIMLEDAKKKYGGDFKITEDDKVDSEKPVGTILSQNPSSGGKLAKGNEISVVVSGTQVAEVPSVVDSTKDKAKQKLSDAGFDEVKITEKESDPDKEGLVIEQDPQSGGKVDITSEIELTVGTGPPSVEVPNIPMGASVAQAKSQLEDADLVLGAVGKAPSTAWAEGSIIDQDPAPGAEIDAGSAVDVTISSGVPQVEVPNVIGLDITTAQQTMLNSGLGYTSVEVQSNETAGTVIATDPGAGVMLDQGTRVTLSYSTGPISTPEPKSKSTPAPEKPAAEKPAPDKQPAEDSGPNLSIPVVKNNGNDSETSNSGSGGNASNSQDNSGSGSSSDSGGD